MTAELEDMIKTYLTQNLGISISIENRDGSYGDRDGLRVTVLLELDGEVITQSQDYVSL